MENKLQNTWVFYEHPRNASGTNWTYTEIGCFDTIEKFWELFICIPEPSKVMFNGEVFPKIENRQIDGYSIFKKDIKPEWEDPSNSEGCELRMHRGVFNLEHLNILWENIVLGLIGEMIEETDEICGCRITDKSKTGKGSSKSIYNIHVWLKYSDEKIVNRIKQKVIQTLASGAHCKIPDFEIHSHKMLPMPTA